MMEHPMTSAEEPAMVAGRQGGIGVKLQDFGKLKKAFDRYVARYDDCIKTAPSRGHLRTYLKGQMGPLPRKSIEPIALEAGVAPRTLQEFLGLHRWDHDAVGRRLREFVRRDHADENAIAVIDESSFPKCGNKTPGVQRQYCGATGKIDNCVTAVHVGYAAGSFHALLDADLYLPESWASDRKRCEDAGIPDDVVYRPKWKIALDLTGRSIAEGIRFRWLAADETYGRVAEFRQEVAKAGLLYMVEVPSDLEGWRQPVRVVAPDGASTNGRPRSKPRLAPNAPERRRVSKFWKRGGPSWGLYRVKDTEKGPVVWWVRESRFYPSSGGLPTGEELRLIVAREVVSGEVKYFLSNAPSEFALKELLAVAFSRWHIEKLYQEGKGEVGMDHVEVRNYTSLIRHLVLTHVSIYFLAEQTEILRGEKPVVVDLPDEAGGGSTVGAGRTAA